MTGEPNPYESPSSSSPPNVTPPSARSQLLPVAVALLAVSILHIFSGLFYFVFVYNMAAAPDADPMFVRISIQNCMYLGITMLYCLLLATGAFSMMRRGSYVWAMTVCILALIPILGPCYILGIPFGIWGIIILRRPDVRDSFASP